MALIHSGYFNGVDAAEPALAPDEYNTGYQLAFEYDTYLEGSSGNTVLRIVRVYLFSALMWYPLNLLGTSPYTGDVASLGIGFNTASVTRQTTSGATGKYWAYDADQNEISNQNPGGGWSEAVTFAYDEIDYPVVYKPHAPTAVLSAGASDKAVSVNVYIEIRDGEVGYLYKGNKSISVTVPRNQWVVKLHPNGGVVDGSSATTVTKTKRYNQTLTIPTPTKTNAVFKGWYTNAQGTGNPVSASYTQNADLELWAIWYEPYAVTYDGNPASSATNVPAQQWKVYNQTLTLSGQKPARSGGYVFKEWNTRSDGTGTSYASGASYSTNAALTLYAIWYPPCGISYNGNGGSDTASVVSNVPSKQIKSHGVALTLSSQKPTRPGYSFAHWNTNSSGTGTSYNPGDTYPASNNANQVLYAIWTPTVDSKAVTVNKSVRTGSISSETEADEGEYAFIDFSYSFVGAASGTVSVSVGRTPEGGTRTAVPAARISGDTAKTKSLGYGTLSGNVKVHDDGGGSLPTTTRYKYDITVTFAGTSATGASYIEKAFFTVSFLGDDVPGQTPGHGVAFGMPATREAFEVGPSMPGHFWAALYAHQNLLVDENVSAGGEITDGSGNMLSKKVTKIQSKYATTDLNTIIEPGIYDISTAANKPSGGNHYGILIVLVMTNILPARITQIYIPGGSYNQMFRRGSSDTGATWSSWFDSNAVIRTEYANSFDGMLDPYGNHSWIRTTNQGLIPYNSGGASALGTWDWYFNSIYGGYVGARTHFTTPRGLDGGVEVGGARLYGNGLVISNPAITADQGWIRMLGTGESDSVLEIATGDDGVEQIVARQYNTSGQVVHEAKLLDINGDTQFSRQVHLNGGNLELRTLGSSSDDSGDIIWRYGSGAEKMRIWSDDLYSSGTGPNFRVYNSSGTNLYTGRLSIDGHTHSYKPYYRRWVDLSSLDQNTWYPVTGTPIPYSGMHELSVDVHLDSGTKPSWSTHAGGFACLLHVVDVANGWGTMDASTSCYVLADQFHWCHAPSPVSYAQMGNSSTPVFYLRGGGAYAITSDYESNWTVHTSTYTTSSQSVSPTSSKPVPRGDSSLVRYVLYNSSASDGTISLSDDTRNYNTLQIFYYAVQGSGEGVMNSIVLRGSPVTWNVADLTVTRGSQGDPRRLWVFSRIVYIGTTYIETYGGANYGRFGANSNNQFGVDDINGIRIYQVIGWNENAAPVS